MRLLSIEHMLSGLSDGDVVQPINGHRGRPRILHFSDVDYLKRLIQRSEERRVGKEC